MDIPKWKKVTRPVRYHVLHMSLYVHTLQDEDAAILAGDDIHKALYQTTASRSSHKHLA